MESLLEKLLPLIDKQLQAYNAKLQGLRSTGAKGLAQAHQVLEWKSNLESFSQQPLRIVQLLNEGKQPQPQEIQLISKAAKQKCKRLQPSFAEKLKEIVLWLKDVTVEEHVNVPTEDQLTHVAQELKNLNLDGESAWSDASMLSLQEDDMKRLQDEFEAEGVDQEIIDAINEELTQLQGQFKAIQKSEVQLGQAKGEWLFSQKISEMFVTALDMHRDKLLSGGGDQTVRVWDIKEKLTLVDQIKLPETIVKFASSQDQSALAIATCDQLFIRYESKLNLIECVTQPLFMQWHSKGLALLVGGKQTQFHIVNQQGRIFQTFFGHQGDVTMGKFTVDGKQIVTVSADASLRVWDPKTGQTIKKIEGYGFHEMEVVCLQLHSKGKLAATGSTDGSCCISNLQTGKVVFKSQSAQQSVEQVEFFQKLDQLASISVDGLLRLYDVAKNKLIKSYDFKSPLNNLLKNQQLNLLGVTTFEGVIHFIDQRVSNSPQESRQINLGSHIHCVLANKEGLLCGTQNGRITMIKW